MSEQSHRKESIKRVRVGLTGLGGIVILLALVNVVVSNVRVGPETMPSTAAVVDNAVVDNASAFSSEPLAELGVTPSSSADGSVPDLKPDPKLHKPMDREPVHSAGR